MPLFCWSTDLFSTTGQLTHFFECLFQVQISLLKEQITPNNYSRKQVFFFLFSFMTHFLNFNVVKIPGVAINTQIQQNIINKSPSPLAALIRFYRPWPLEEWGRTKIVCYMKNRNRYECKPEGRSPAAGNFPTTKVQFRLMRCTKAQQENINFSINLVMNMD